MNQTLLLIDDEKTIRQSLGYYFGIRGYEMHEAGSAAAGISLAQSVQPDLVILDYRLPDKTGLDALAELKAANPDCTVIMLTGFGNIPDAVEAIKRGAFDYLTKPVDLQLLEIAITRASELQVLKKENRLLKDFCSAAREEGVIGGSREIHKLLLMVGMLAENHNTTVLIEGESGTGKELAARTVHRLSSRRGSPIVDINCASLSGSLLESELFGHEKGAFTDAKGLKRGLLEVADGGTLFLDEIGELSPELQPKLLRVLETKTFRRVGGTRDIKVDIRIMAATNRNLKEAVEQKLFREDLFYRLSVMPITMPPLRERGRDVILLADHFIRENAKGLKKMFSGLSQDCEDYLLNYRWPGNVRELKNVIERACILSAGPLIEPLHLPSELKNSRPGRPATAAPQSLEEVERRHIKQVLAMNDGNHTRTAKVLDISRSTLINKLKKYDLL